MLRSLFFKSFVLGERVMTSARRLFAVPIWEACISDTSGTSVGYQAGLHIHMLVQDLQPLEGVLVLARIR